MLRLIVAHASNVGLPQVIDGGRSVRLLRLRADDRLRGALQPGSAAEAARLHVSSRASVDLGELVAVEVSFGPLADEIVLHGAVAEVQPTSKGRSPRVVIALPRGEIDRVRYVRSVLDGSREARARRDRRIPVDLAVTWRWGRARYASRVRDLSRGGAFIASRCLPTVGAQVEIAIDSGAAGDALSLPAIVSWVRTQGSEPGFGVHFRHQSRDEAARLTAVVREHDPR
jgi:Tfp pilus assembly protein PilZ